MARDRGAVGGVGRQWPLLAALVLFLVLVGAIAVESLELTRGELTYALDDPYIHMSIARSLAEHGVWGLDGATFASASSSVAWPLVLAAAFRLQAAAETAPLVLNVVAGLALLAAVHVFLVRRGVTGWQGFLVLVAVVTATPLAPLAFTGMEHVAHAFAAVLFLALWVEALEAPGDSRVAGCLVAAAFLLGAVRYEGLLEVGLAALVLLVRGRVRLAVAVALAAALPGAAFAAVSLSHGWHALPNSVLLKGSRPQGLGPSTLLPYAMARLRLLWANPAPLGLALLGTALLARRRSAGAGSSAGAWLFAGTLLAHGAVASFGWFFRYEAYLMALGFTALGSLLLAGGGEAADRRWGRTAAAALLAGLCLLPSVSRAFEAHRMAPLASKNIYEQQVQMARFFASRYAGRGVAANDIGALSYYGRVRLLDLLGLADLSICDRRRAGRFDAAAVHEAVSGAGVEAAAVYGAWFQDRLPPDWVEVGRWKITPRVVVGSSELVFYAVGAGRAAELSAALRSFSRELPPTVEVRLSPLP